MFIGVDHIELIVRNLDETIAFYEVLGFEKTRETEHHGRSVELTLNGRAPLVLEMHEPEMEEYIGINHIAYAIPDMEAAVEAITSAGARLERGPVVARYTGRHLANFRDPDGWRLQIVTPEGGVAASEDGEGPVLWLDHLDWYSRDVEAYAAFYQSIGLNRRRELEHAKVHTIELEMTGNPTVTMELKQVGDLRVIGLNHLGFACKDVEDCAERLKKHGARLDYEPKFVEATNRKLFTARDPDGWRVQFTQV